MSDLTKRVDELAKELGENPSQVIEEALEYGVNELWKKNILSKYLKDEISREKAIELTGIKEVRRAERETKAVKEDIEWGLKN